MIFNKFPSRGKKIKDATAIANDVIYGEIFYNNSGRQVGTLKCKEIKSTTISKGDLINVPHGGSNFLKVKDAIGYPQLGSSIRPSTYGHASLIVDDIKSVIGVECNGVFYDIYYVNTDLLPCMLGALQYKFNSVEYEMKLRGNNDIALSYHFESHTVIVNWEGDGADDLTIYYIGGAI